SGIRTQLQRADFYRCSAWTDCGSGGDTGGQRHGTVIASGGPRGTATAEKASTDGGRQRLYDAREYREDGRTRGRFSGDHATRRCAARSQPAEPVSTERISLSAGEEPLCLSGGQSPASAGTTQGGSRDDLPHLRSPVGGLSKLPTQTGVLPGQQEERPFGSATGRKPGSDGVSQEDGPRGSPGAISSSWTNRGVLSRMDQSKLGLRQFHVRGLKKVQAEMLWACLTYNLQFWIRLSRLRTTPAVT